MERALGAGAVGGQSAIVADLTGWKKQKNRQGHGQEHVNHVTQPWNTRAIVGP